MSVEEFQIIAGIVGDLTVVSMLSIAIVYVERRRVFLSQEIFDDWRDMKAARIRRMETYIQSPDE